MTAPEKHAKLSAIFDEIAAKCRDNAANVPAILAETLGNLPSGVETAFPATISCGNCIAHTEYRLMSVPYSLSKIDIGLRIGGFILDQAVTLGPIDESVRQNIEFAVHFAGKMVRDDTQIAEIEAAIAECLSGLPEDWHIIDYLCSHSIDEYRVHSGNLIFPNPEARERYGKLCDGRRRIAEGDRYSIEIFAVNTKFPYSREIRRDDKACTIYNIEDPSGLLPATRRALFEKYRHLPFSTLDLSTKMRAEIEKLPPGIKGHPPLYYPDPDAQVYQLEKNFIAGS